MVLSADHAAPRVSFDVVYRIGHADDPPGRPMMASFMAELLAGAATRHLGRAQRAGLFLSLGLEPVAAQTVTRLDDTQITVADVPSNQLELYLWLLADRFAFGLDELDDAALRDARAAVDKAHAETESRPHALVGDRLREALYGPSHPYGVTMNGDAGALAQLTPAEIRARARALYTPANAALVVTGDFAPAAARALVEKYFGPIAKGPPLPAPREVPPARLPGERRLQLEAGVPEAQLVLAWPTARFAQPDDLALDLLAGLLTHRLQHRLLGDGKPFENVSVAQLSRTRESCFVITVTLAPGGSAAAALPLVDAELDRLRAADTSPDELHAVMAEQLGHLGAIADSSRYRALRLGSSWGLGADPTYLGPSFAAYTVHSAASLRAAALANLPPGKRVVALVIPSREAPPAGRFAPGAP